MVDNNFIATVGWGVICYGVR